MSGPCVWPLVSIRGRQARGWGVVFPEPGEDAAAEFEGGGGECAGVGGSGDEPEGVAGVGAFEADGFGGWGPAVVEAVDEQNRRGGAGDVVKRRHGSKVEAVGPAGFFQRRTTQPRGLRRSRPLCAGP